MAYFLPAFFFDCTKAFYTFKTYTYWCLFLYCYSFFHLLEMGNILFCTCLHDFWHAFSKVHNSMSISKYKPRSQSSHISFALTLQQFPLSTGKARSWPLTSLIVWSRKPHCALLSRLDKWLQKISLRQVEGQVKWNLIDETVQETNLVHTVLCKDKLSLLWQYKLQNKRHHGAWHCVEPICQKEAEHQRS